MPKSSKLTDADRATIQRMLDDGASVVEIAEAIGTSKERVCGALQAFKRRPRQDGSGCCECGKHAPYRVGGKPYCVYHGAVAQKRRATGRPDMVV